MANVIERTRTFVGESREEMKKTTWPTRSELGESTVVVIVSVILVSIFIGLVDAVMSLLLRLFTNLT